MTDLRVDPFREMVLELCKLIPDEEKWILIPHLDGTPDRLRRMYQNDLLVGYAQDPETILKAVFEDRCNELVIVRNIKFYSLCSHHLVSFSGVAHVGYLPNGKVVGLSKLARVVECFARRLQVQELLTRQIAEALGNSQVLQPQGAACVIESTHLCMGCRGIQKPDAETVTSALTGAFLTDTSLKAEFFSLIKGGRQ